MVDLSGLGDLLPDPEPGGDLILSVIGVYRPAGVDGPLPHGEEHGVAFREVVRAMRDEEGISDVVVATTIRSTETTVVPPMLVDLEEPVEPPAGE